MWQNVYWVRTGLVTVPKSNEGNTASTYIYLISYQYPINYQEHIDFSPANYANNTYAGISVLKAADHWKLHSSIGDLHVFDIVFM